MHEIWKNFFDCKCESPIEKTLAAALFKSLIYRAKREPSLTHNKRIDFVYLNNKHVIWSRITPQAKLGGYRTDFGLMGWVATPEKLSSYRLGKIKSTETLVKTYQFAIECDGHAFHEKTKEQAARDKSRDRDIAMRGISIVRFTGSEIYNDANECAEQICDMMDAANNRTLELIDSYSKSFA